MTPSNDEARGLSPGCSMTPELSTLKFFHRVGLGMIVFPDLERIYKWPIEIDRSQFRKITEEYHEKRSYCNIIYTRFRFGRLDLSVGPNYNDR